MYKRQNVSFEVESGDHIGFVGVNGCGKSTLFRILLGEEQADEGTVNIPGGTKIGSMNQNVSAEVCSLFDYVLQVFSELSAIEAETDRINSEIAAAGGDVDPKLIERQHALNEKYWADGGSTYRARTRSTLLGLGFTEDELSRSINSFSGGQRNKAQLAKLLLSDANLLLLDEPTNHLDIAMTEWLEKYLQEFKGGLLVVSHDRAFLDNIATRILEMEGGHLTSFKGNYSKYLVQKELQTATLEAAYASQQDYIARTEAYIRRFKAGIKSKMARGRQSQLDRLERMDAPVQHEEFALRLPPAPESAERVLILDNLSVGYGDNVLLHDIDLVLRKGEKVGLLGPNGTGKTTLLQSAVMSLSLCYSPEQVHLYLMDFGGGSLRLFRELPHVGGIVDGDDAQKQSKLTTMLIDTLDRRKKLLAGQGLVSIDAYREATGEQLPWIVLLLDHVAPALELYPDIDGFLQTLVRDGAACGMYLLVSAGAVNALPYRISQHIKAAVCLRMTDRGDYAQIVGKTNGLEPENLAGRGLVRSTPPLEFQTALPAAGKREIDRVNEIRRLAGLMRGAWTGACPPPIPVLPEVVDWREYPSEQILCGLTEQSVQPCFAALAQEQFLLISCAQDGSSTVQAIFAQAAEKLAPAKHIVFHGAQAQAAAAFDGEIAALMPEMQKRKDASAGSTDWPWILICIDDLKRCIDSINDQTLRRLASILVLGKGLRVAVIVSGNAADITKLSASGERFTMEMTGKTTLLLGGSAQAHMFARTDLAYSAASQDAGAGMGYLVQDGHAVKLKAVQK